MPKQSGRRQKLRFWYGMPSSKICKECGEKKPIEKFYKTNGTTDGYRRRCIACIKAEKARMPVREGLSEECLAKYKSTGPKCEVDRSVESVINTNLFPFDMNYIRSGVYFLCRNGEVVYIGQAVKIAARIAAHFCGFGYYDKSEFDYAYFMFVPRERLDEVEGALIRFYRPKLNGRYYGVIIQAPNPKGVKEEDYEEHDIEILKEFGFIKEGMHEESIERE